jgi:hypothetical protein
MPTPEELAALEVQQAEHDSLRTDAEREVATEPTLEEIAAASGWKPKDQWTRAPEEWTSAAEFLRGQGDRFSRLRESNEQLKKDRAREVAVAERLAERMSNEAREAAEADVRRAAEVGDPEAAADAARRLADAKPATNPQVERWAAQNSTWFGPGGNAEATAFAQAVAGQQASMNASVGEQLDAAEAAVKKRFPELFGRQEPPRTPPGGAAGGGFARAPAPAGPKGFAQLPSAVKQIALAFERQTAGKSVGKVTKEDYAKTYWQEQEGA